MRHLLIWECVPEDTFYFVMNEGEHDEMISCAKEAHGYFINAECNEACEKLNGLLYNANGDSPDGLIKCDKSLLPPGPYMAVYVSGFIL